MHGARRMMYEYEYEYDPDEYYDTPWYDSRWL